MQTDTRQPIRLDSEAALAAILALVAAIEKDASPAREPSVIDRAREVLTKRAASSPA